MVFSGQDSKSEKCEKTRRLIYSIDQDIFHIVTNGEWKLPKHVLICLTIRHLYRNKQPTQILNRKGHCESYQYGLEVETALAEALDNSSTHLTSHIVIVDSNLVFHSEWVNPNKITTNLTGSNVVNSAAGIMLQKVKHGFEHVPYQNMKELQRIRKQATKTVFWKHFRHSQYTIVLDQSFLRMPLSFLHRKTFLNLMYVY